MLLGGLWHGAAWTFVIWGACTARCSPWRRWDGKRPSIPRCRAPGASAATFVHRAPHLGVLPRQHAVDVARFLRRSSGSVGTRRRVAAGAVAMRPPSLGTMVMSALIVWGGPQTLGLDARAHRRRGLLAIVLLLVLALVASTSRRTIRSSTSSSEDPIDFRPGAVRMDSEERERMRARSWADRRRTDVAFAPHIRRLHAGLQCARGAARRAVRPRRNDAPRGLRDWRVPGPGAWSAAGPDTPATLGHMADAQRAAAPRARSLRGTSRGGVPVRGPGCGRARNQPSPDGCVPATSRWSSARAAGCSIGPTSTR